MQRPYHPMQRPYHLTKGPPRMDLAAQLRDRLADPSLTHEDRARLRCRVAKELEERGEYEDARTELAYCYWRQGAFDEARDILREVLGRLTDSTGEVKLVAVIRSAIVE